MIFVKNSRGGREVNMINTLSKINLSKIGWEGGRSTSIWIMSLNILGFFLEYPSGTTPCIEAACCCLKSQDNKGPPTVDSRHDTKNKDNPKRKMTKIKKTTPKN